VLCTRLPFIVLLNAVSDSQTVVLTLGGGVPCSDHACWERGVSETSSVLLLCRADRGSRILVELAADGARVHAAADDLQNYDGRGGGTASAASNILVSRHTTR